MPALYTCQLCSRCETRQTHHTGQAPFEVIDMSIPHGCGGLRRRRQGVHVLVASQVAGGVSRRRYCKQTYRVNTRINISTYRITTRLVIYQTPVVRAPAAPRVRSFGLNHFHLHLLRLLLHPSHGSVYSKSAHRVSEEEPDTICERIPQGTSRQWLCVA